VKETEQSWEASRQIEDNFFKRNKLWNKTEKARLGTGNLTQALSKKLSQMIEETLIFDN
jgi:hypothetical protein